MSWRDAFLRQARSENLVRRKLNDPAVEYSHRLHYVQMVTEKLAKGLLADPNDPDPPPATHHALVRLIQVLKARPEVRRRLGYDDAAVFRSFIYTLLPLAAEIESLAPSAAGLTRPNPEYPWKDPATAVVFAPAEFRFETFSPGDPRMVKFEALLNLLLRVFV